jgi:hypothetical protein
MSRLDILFMVVLGLFAWSAEAAPPPWCERGEVATDGARVVHDDSFVSPARLCARPFSDPFKAYSIDPSGNLVEDVTCEQVDAKLYESRHPDIDGDHVVFANYDAAPSDIFVYNPSFGDPPHYNLTDSDEREDFPSIVKTSVAFQVWNDTEARWYVDIEKLDQAGYWHVPMGHSAKHTAFPTVAGLWVFFEMTNPGVAAPGSQGARIGFAKIDSPLDTGTIKAMSSDARAPHAYNDIVAFTYFDTSGSDSRIAFLPIPEMDQYDEPKIPDKLPSCTYLFQPRVGGVDGNYIIFAGYDHAECRDLPLYLIKAGSAEPAVKIASLGIDPAGLTTTEVVGLLHESRPRYDIAPGENKVVYTVWVGPDSYEVQTFTW